MVSDVNIGTALNQQSRTNAASNQLAADFNQFLTLLTTQLQNQDPLSPMDSTEFTNQLVAFAGVEQQINLNQKLDSLVSLQLSNSLGSALGYVGMDISYLSSEGYFDGTNPMKIKYALDDVAVETKIRIFNEAGEVVREETVSSNAGIHDFNWDGKDDEGNLLEAGTYEIKVDSLDVNGQAVGSSIVVTGNVRGVETQNGIIYLLVGDRAVALGNVLNANLPEIAENDNGDGPDGPDDPDGPDGPDGPDDGDGDDDGDDGDGDGGTG